MPIPLMLIESMVLASIPIVVMSLPSMAVLFWVSRLTQPSRQATRFVTCRCSRDDHSGHYRDHYESVLKHLSAKPSTPRYIWQT